MKTIKTHFSFDLPVKAGRIKRARRYSDCIVVKFANGVNQGKTVVAAHRPIKDPNGVWEPECLIKK